MAIAKGPVNDGTLLTHRNCNHGFSCSRYPQRSRSRGPGSPHALGWTLTTDCGETLSQPSRITPREPPDCPGMTGKRSAVVESYIT